MNAADLPNELRALAQRIEDAGFAPETTINVSLDAHGVDSRDELAKWANFIGKPELDRTSDWNYLKSYGWRPGNKFDVTVFFKPGLLGGEVVEVCKDSEAGLAALMAEYPAAVKETAVVA